MLLLRGDFGKSLPCAVDYIISGSSFRSSLPRRQSPHEIATPAPVVHEAAMLSGSLFAAREEAWRLAAANLFTQKHRVAPMLILRCLCVLQQHPLNMNLDESGGVGGGVGRAMTTSTGRSLADKFIKCRRDNAPLCAVCSGSTVCRALGRQGTESVSRGRFGYKRPSGMAAKRNATLVYKTS